jgi:4-hydroxybenzoate polyprenyltransferase
MRTSRLKQKIKGYFDLIRPFTILAPIIVSTCIIIASFFYNKIGYELNDAWFAIILPASFSLAILNSASNALNQLTDIKSDEISKPYRPIIRGDVTVLEAKVISLVLYITGFLLSLLINHIFMIFVSMIILFTVTYSITPRLKDFLFFNQLWIGIPRGLLGVLASWSVFGNPFDTLPLIIAVIAMCFLCGGSITKDITDSEADKKNGTRTLVNTYGVRKASLLVLPLMFFPFAFIPILIDIGALQPYLWWLTLISAPGILISYLMLKDDKKTKVLENTSSWILMYVTYLMFASGFSILTIIGSVAG